jgi:hypothetical protein
MSQALHSAIETGIRDVTFTQELIQMVLNEPAYYEKCHY